jgi:hypothetical protein
MEVKTGGRAVKIPLFGPHQKALWENSLPFRGHSSPFIWHLIISKQHPAFATIKAVVPRRRCCRPRALRRIPGLAIGKQTETEIEGLPTMIYPFRHKARLCGQDCVQEFIQAGVQYIAAAAAGYLIRAIGEPACRQKA